MILNKKKYEIDEAKNQKMTRRCEKSQIKLPKNHCF